MGPVESSHKPHFKECPRSDKQGGDLDFGLDFRFRRRHSQITVLVQISALDFEIVL